MKVAGFLVVASLVGSGCATSHVSRARFVARAPSGGVVATPTAEVGMDDANAMIAAHCGSGGYSITREGEALVGNTVVTEGANSVDAQTTDGAGQVQGHDSSKIVYATGSDWQVHYSCNDPRTVNMGLITRSRTEPGKIAWGADVGAGAMVLAGHGMEQNPEYSATRGGAGTALAGNAWVGLKLSQKFILGGGIGMASVIAMPQWDRYWDNGTQREMLVTKEQDATALEFFAAAKYAAAERIDVGVRVGLSTWNNVSIAGTAPFAAFQLGYRVIDVGADSGVYVAAAVSSYFSSSLTNNAMPALMVGFH
ncbi:MAG: hypothetical protein AB7O24_06335 [Kofleriaceae bacterium]